MTRRALFLAALLACGSAFAQADKAPAKPQPKAEAAKAEGMKRKPIARQPNPRRSQDARHCLNRETNTDIIKCAEAYL